MQAAQLDAAIDPAAVLVVGHRRPIVPAGVADALVARRVLRIDGVALPVVLALVVALRQRVGVGAAHRAGRTAGGERALLHAAGL